MAESMTSENRTVAKTSTPKFLDATNMSPIHGTGPNEQEEQAADSILVSPFNLPGDSCTSQAIQEVMLPVVGIPEATGSKAGENLGKYQGDVGDWIRYILICE